MLLSPLACRLTMSAALKVLDRSRPWFYNAVARNPELIAQLDGARGPKGWSFDAERVASHSRALNMASRTVQCRKKKRAL